MANWKKVIVSGSSAELAHLTASLGIQAELPAGSDTTYVTINSDGDLKKRSLPTIPAAANNATITLTAGDGLKTGGTFTTNQSSDSEITFDIDVDVIAGVGLTADNTTEELDVSAAQTGITSIKNNSLIIGGNSQNNTIDFGTDDEIIFDIDNTQIVQINGSGLEITGSLNMSSHISTSGFISASGYHGNSIAHADDPNTGIFFSSDAVGIQGNGSEIINLNTTLIRVSESIDLLPGKTITGQLNGGYTGSGANITAGTIAATAVTVTDSQFIVGDGANKGASVAMSGDVTLARDGQVTIGNDKVSNAKLANMTRGTVKVGGTSNAPTDLNAKTSGQILVGDGTDIVSVAVGGDAALSADGSLVINNNAINGDKLADDIVIARDLTVTRNLVVSGDVTQVNVTNLAVDDAFILLKSGSDSGDGGIIVQTAGDGATPSGAGLGYDDTLSRWVLTGPDLLNYNDTAFATADRAQMIVAVSQSAGAPTGNPSDLGGDAASRRGLMFVDTSTEDIYIFS